MIGEQLRRQELERHFPAEEQIFGTINDTHPAAAELAQHAIVRNRLSEHCESSTMAVWPPEVNRLEPSRYAFSRPLPYWCRRRRRWGFHPFGNWVIGKLTNYPF